MNKWYVIRFPSGRSNSVQKDSGLIRGRQRNVNGSNVYERQAPKKTTHAHNFAIKRALKRVKEITSGWTHEVLSIERTKIFRIAG